MKSVAAIVVSLLIIGGLAWLLLNDESSTSIRHSDVSVEQSSTLLPAPDLAEEKPVLHVESKRLIEARQRIRNATLALRAAVAERERAEADLQQAERDVAALERFIEEIEERGEDPVDYADEGLAKFQPAFYAYQNAFDRLELAETMEEAATEELTGAEDRLAQILAESRNE